MGFTILAKTLKACNNSNHTKILPIINNNLVVNSLTTNANKVLIKHKTNCIIRHLANCLQEETCNNNIMCNPHSTSSRDNQCIHRSRLQPHFWANKRMSTSKSQLHSTSHSCCTTSRSMPPSIEKTKIVLSLSKLMSTRHLIDK